MVTLAQTYNLVCWQLHEPEINEVSREESKKVFRKRGARPHPLNASAILLSDCFSGFNILY
jgi:hypothetical protein